MGILTEALRKEAEKIDASIRKEISNLDKDGLVVWCRDYIAAQLDMSKRFKEKMQKPAVVAEDDELALLDVAKTVGYFHELLKEETKSRRLGGKLVPDAWQNYLSDVYIGVKKKPDGRGQKSNYARDCAICYCIRQITEHTSYKATRGVSQADKDCAVSIVSEALKNIGYDAVERVWKDRPKNSDATKE